MRRALLMSVAVLVGYVLGRRRNLRAALMLGAAAAAGRASANRGSLLAQGRRLLSGAGEGAVGELSGLARPLVEAGKAAARTVVTDRIDSVSDRLRDRTDSLRGRTTKGRKDEDEGREDRGPEDEDYEAEFEEEEEEEPEPPRRSRQRAQRHEPEREHEPAERDRDEAEPPVRRRARSGQR